MNITVLRHGPVDLQPPTAAITSKEFGDWVSRYDEANIDAASVPPAALLGAVGQARFVICSDLKRSIRSAELLNRKVDLVNALYRECEMPRFTGERIKLPVNIWMTSMRAAQCVGIHANAESLSDFRSRTKQCASELNALAGIHRSVVLCGHGLLNNFLHKPLRKLGWSSTTLHGSASGHWSYRVYSRSGPDA